MKDLLNCPNCGAPINGSKCEYCGTVFEKSDDIYETNILYADNLLIEELSAAIISASQTSQTNMILNSLNAGLFSQNDIRQSTQTSIDELNRFQYQNLRASTNVYPYVEHVPYPETKETFWQKVKNWWNMNSYLFGF